MNRNGLFQRKIDRLKGYLKFFRIFLIFGLKIHFLFKEFKLFGPDFVNLTNLNFYLKFMISFHNFEGFCFY